MKNIITLAAFFLVGCITRESASPTFSGGNGESHADAIVMHHGRDDDAVRAAEESWLRYRYSGARIVKRVPEIVISSSHGSGVRREYEAVSFITVAGETKTVYFDVTEFVR